VLGGTETLIMRLLKWYKKKSYRVILLTEEKIEDLALLKDINEHIMDEYYTYDRREKKFKTVFGKRLSFSNTEIVAVISFTFFHFLKCFRWLENRERRNLFLYCIYIVHPYSNYILSPRAKPLNKLFKPLVSFLIKRKLVIFMDEETHDTCYNFYKLMQNHKSEIIRLPMEIIKNDTCKSKNTELNLLTISRLEFPFKAYVLGLIDAFSRLVRENGNMKLTVIGYGDGEIIVKEKIMALVPDIQNKIKLIKQVPYSEIGDYIDRCDVYIGMGTTILDAANHNKICITAVSYQKSDFSIGFFHDEGLGLGGIYKEDLRLSYFHFYDLLDQIVNLDESEFIERKRRTKMLLAANFDIDNNAPQVISCCYRFSGKEKVLLIIYKYIADICNICAIIAKHILNPYNKTADSSYYNELRQRQNNALS
jgi:hypothetical protein